MAWVAGVILSVALACAVFTAESAEQRWFGAKADYSVAVNAAADYCQHAQEHPERFGWCQRAVEASRVAALVLAHGDTVVRAPVSERRNDRLLQLAGELIELTLELRRDHLGVSP